MGREQQILHGASGRTNFVQVGNFAARFPMGGNGDYSLGLLEVLTKLGTLFRPHFSHRGDLIIETLEGVG